VEDFIAQDPLEDRERLRIVVHQLAIDLEPAGGRFLGDVQEGEQAVVGLPLDAEIVEAVTTGQRIAVEQAGAVRSALAQQCRTAAAKEIAVVQFVDRVFEVEAAQQRIRRDLRGAHNVAAAVGFDVREGEQFSQAAIAVAPDPAVHGTHQAVDARDGFCHTRFVFPVRAIFVAGGAAVYRQLPMTVFLSSRAGNARSRAFDLVIAAVGVACLGIAIAANQRWLDRHFLPSFFVPRDWYVRAESGARAALAAIGLALTLAAPRIGRAIIRAPGRGASIAAAAILALVAGEIVLQVAPPRPLGWLVPNDEPRRQPDARLGWVLVPGRVGRTIAARHTIEYAIDGNGYRVRRLDQPVDRTHSAIVFAGESVMFGEGLSWDETIPAQVGTLLSLQTANLAVHGYSTDQMYLRLERELPLFRQPVAVVALFMTSLFGRNLDDDRPHLDADLAWHPAQPHTRVMSLAGLLVPYRRDTTVDAGVRMTRGVLRAIRALAHARGAAALVVVPQIGAEAPPEEALRRRVLDGNGIPYVVVTVDPLWRLSWNRHPDSRAAQLIAGAIAAKLRTLSIGAAGANGDGSCCR